MLFGWFDASDAKHCGFVLAQMVINGYSVAERKKSTKALDHRTKLLDQVMVKARQFSQTHKPNIYKKAKLGNIFKWELLGQGFDVEFVDDLTHQILLNMK